MTASDPRNSLLNPKVQRHRRLRYALEVDLQGDSMAERVRTFDISAGGLFVDTANSYPLGTTVRLRFRIDTRYIESPARVIHVRQDVGFGAEFLELGPAERAEILRFVHRERARREACRLLGKNDESEADGTLEPEFLGEGDLRPEDIVQ